jgi:hypothetical protein
VAGLLNHDSEGKPHVLLATGDFAHIADDGQVDDLLSRPARMIAELARGARVPVERLEPAAIAKGAALYASRRARQWATYLDELPPVEIVVQSQGGARWKHLLKESHYDAGTPVEIKLDHFYLNAGERQILLPVYVHEFGEDTPDVLASKVEFQHATRNKTGVEVVVEIEAATGLPVVRATVHGDLNETAEVDWVNDRVSAHTGMTKAGYLDSLPRAFPPIEVRIAGHWWVMGGRYKTASLVGIDSNEYTGDQLAARLPQLFAAGEDQFETGLTAFLRLAKKKERCPTSLAWLAATDSEGRNSRSSALENAATTLYDAVRRKWLDQKLSNNAGQALAALCWGDRAWVCHLLGESKSICSIGERHYIIAGLGACVSEECEMAGAVEALACRIRSNLQSASQRGTDPKGVGTLSALGNLLSLRAEAMKEVADRTALQLADDVSEFIERSLNGGGFKTKFQSCLRTMVYLTRRRAYQSDFLAADSQAFTKIVKSCARVYIATRLVTSGRSWHAITPAIFDAVKRDLKELKREGRARSGLAMDATCAIIDSVGMSELKFARKQYPSNPAKLLALLVQVIEYIEGRGTGILVIDESDDGDGGGAANGGGAGGNSDGGGGG